MKNKRIKRSILGIFLAVIVLTVTACAGAKYGYKTEVNTEEKSADSPSSYVMDKADNAMPMESTASSSDAGIESSTHVLNDSKQISGQKLIKDVSMVIQTRTFDDFIVALNSQIESVGGYVESSDVSGGGYEFSSYRYAYIIARVPADRLDGFINIVKEKGNVTHMSEQTTDVTLQYVDIESRLKALKIEQETLMNLLENATKMEDIIAIQSQLTDVRYQIESNESQIRTFDNLVNYSTVRIEVNEVERETPVETRTFAGEVKAKLSNNLYALKEGFKNFLIELIASLPYIIVYGLVLFIFILIGRKIYKKNKTKIPFRKNKKMSKTIEKDIVDENDKK